MRSVIDIIADDVDSQWPGRRRRQRRTNTLLLMLIESRVDDSVEGCDREHSSH
jgi:hypothetical protein